jgi:hypothetical protein
MAGSRTRTYSCLSAPTRITPTRSSVSFTTWHFFGLGQVTGSLAGSEARSTSLIRRGVLGHGAGRGEQHHQRQPHAGPAGQIADVPAP